MARTPATRRKRCLIVERHVWETGGNKQQLQFVLDTARDFFGPGNQKRTIHVRVFTPGRAHEPAFERDIEISAKYANGTRRTNRFPEMGGFPASFVFFEETPEANEYDMWWQTDTAVVAARYRNWKQGGNSQHGRGRLSAIVDAPVPRFIDRID